MAERNQEDLLARVNVSQAILGKVIHTIDNLDEKVGRIFTSVSFLAVGATILFTAFLGEGLVYRVDGVAMVPVLFVLFWISVALATAFMLQAIGPKLGKSLRARAKPSVGPRPTGYAYEIAAMKEPEWTEYFKGIPLSELYEQWSAESVREAHALSKKVEWKAREMGKAQLSFLAAIVFFVAMIILAMSSYL